MLALLLIIGAYFLGSIPFSHIFPKIKGKDVRQAGTKNIGATNALVVAGPIMGALALAGDIAKGYLPVLLAGYLFHNPWITVLVGIAAICGHDFSIFLKFKGGKGIATTGGILLAFDFVFAFIVLLIWILLMIVTRLFIASTLIMLIALPVMMLVLGFEAAYVFFAVVALGLALYTHRRDIIRIISGQELSTSEAVKLYMKK